MKTKAQVLFIASSLILSGCGVVPLMGPAYLALTHFNMNQEGAAQFRIKRNDPDARSVEMIRRAKAIAIFPSLKGSDGDAVDLFRQGTNLEVVSSTKTIEWVTTNKTSPVLRSMPASERTETVARMSRSVGADLGMFVLSSKQDVQLTGLSSTSLEAKVDFTTYIVDAKTAKILWVEDQQVFANSGSNKPTTANEINAAAAKGIALRLMDLRLGRDPTAAKAT